jgi:hypothetical protein
MLAEYWYCAAQVTNRKIQGDIETPLLLEGRRLHEEEAEKILAKLGPTRRIKVSTVLDALLLSRHTRRTRQHRLHKRQEPDNH